MPKKGKILSLPSVTWFLSLYGACWGSGRMSRSPPCPPVAAGFQGQKGSAGGGRIRVGVSQGDGEWEFIPQQAENQTGMSTKGNTQMQTGTAVSCWGDLRQPVSDR